MYARKYNTERNGHLPFRTPAEALVYQDERVDYTNRDRRIIVTRMTGLLFPSAFAYSVQ